MSQPQTGILPEPSQSALFLILRVRHPQRNARSVAEVASRIPALTQRTAKTDPRAKLVSVVSFGPEFWDAISPGRRPKGFVVTFYCRSKTNRSINMMKYGIVAQE